MAYLGRGGGLLLSVEMLYLLCGVAAAQTQTCDPAADKTCQACAARCRATIKMWTCRAFRKSSAVKLSLITIYEVRKGILAVRGTGQ